jgi:heptosyltransferase-3
MNKKTASSVPLPSTRSFLGQLSKIRTIVRKRLWGSEAEKTIARHRLALRKSYFLNYLRMRRLTLLIRSLRKRELIVISQIMHMGDIVACEPVISHIRRTVPNAFIVFALHKDYRGLADSHPEVNYTLAVECVSEWIQFAQSRLFNRVIDLNIYGRSCPICMNPWNKPTGDHGVTIENFYNHGCLLKVFTIGAGIDVELTGPKISNIS